MNLPEDLKAFLQEGKPLVYDVSKCNPGRVTILPVDKLKSEIFPTGTGGRRDPNTGKSGSYLVRAVSLIDTCEHYSPPGLLLWLPLEKRYGTWDQAHYELHIFGADVSWTDIAADFPRHMNAQWTYKESAPVKKLAPWVHHTYNAKQVAKPLPDLPEWYEVEWTRRQMHPEMLKMRIERHGNTVEVTSQVRLPTDEEQWSPVKRLSLSLDELRKLDTELQKGFWDEPDKDPRGLVSNPPTYWSFKGFKDGRYQTLYRSYNAEHAGKGHATHELGKRLAELAKAGQFEFDR